MKCVMYKCSSVSAAIKFGCLAAHGGWRCPFGCENQPLLLMIGTLPNSIKNQTHRCAGLKIGTKLSLIK